MEVNKKFAVASATLTHNELIHGKMAKQFFTHDTQLYDCYKTVKPGSLLACSYNHVWINTLRRVHELNLRYLAILHADIIPDDFWIDKLIHEAEIFDADVMSAVVPIKEASGVTSTGISSDDPFVPYMRLSQRQINDPAFPKTFDIGMINAAMMSGSLDKQHVIDIPSQAKLLVNTGCCVIRVDRKWCEYAYFTIRDRIRRVENDMMIAEVESEDWFFSRLVAELGGLVMATTKVVTEHIGSVEYRSDLKWGDPLDAKSIYNQMAFNNGK